MDHTNPKTIAIGQTDFYLQRAAEAAADAAASPLQNVRDNASRSEAAWREMAALSAARDVSRAEMLAAKPATETVPDKEDTSTETYGSHDARPKD